MRRLLPLPVLALLVVGALPAVGQEAGGYICTSVGTVYEIPVDELPYYPDALPTVPDCPPEVVYPEDVPVEPDVPMPDDPTGFVLNELEDTGELGRLALHIGDGVVAPPSVSSFDPALDQRFGARSAGKGGYDKCRKYPWKCDTTTTTVVETTTTTEQVTTTIPETTTTEATTTTVAETTSTSEATTTTQGETTTAPTVSPSSVTTPDTSTPNSTLPFTGPSRSMVYGLAATGLGLLILGGMAILEARR